MSTPPRIDYDCPIDTYHADHAIGSTDLKRAGRSVAHYATPDHRDSSAMSLGGLAHAAILEPATVWERYAEPFAAPDGLVPDTSDGLKSACADHGLPTSGTKAVLADRLREVGVRLEVDALDKWRWQNRDREIVTREDIDRAYAMRNSVAALDAARAAAGLPRVLPGGHVAEASIWWDDDATGLRCRCRPDALAVEGGILITDLKTTQDASPVGFARSVARYRYDLSAAHYVLGVAAAQSAGLLPEGPIRWLWLAVESSAPYAAAVYSGDEWIAGAMQDRAALMDKIAHWVANGGAAPGYGHEIINLEPPVWLRRQWESNE